MQTLAVALPTAGGLKPATLYYERSYSQGGHWLDLLHLIRQWPVYLGIPNPDSLEGDYWGCLDGFRQGFATDCA
jgi:hypothetical protein